MYDPKKHGKLPLAPPTGCAFMMMPNGTADLIFPYESAKEVQAWAENITTAVTSVAEFRAKRLAAEEEERKKGEEPVEVADRVELAVVKEPAHPDVSVSNLKNDARQDD